jgi:hypothetical protein
MTPRHPTSGYGNDGAVERAESQKQASPSFHAPLGNLAQNRRDSHIPTASARRSGKAENQQQVSHFSLTPRDDDYGFAILNPGGLRRLYRRFARQKGTIPQPPTPPIFRIILYWKRKTISGSFFNWKMLLDLRRCASFG